MIGGYLTWLLNKAVLLEYVQQIIYRKVVHIINYRSMSTIIYRRVVHTINYRSMFTIIYKNKLSEYVHYYISEGCPQSKLINIGGLSTIKTYIFVLKIVFHTWHIAC